MITPAYVRTMASYNRWQNENLYGAAGTLGEEERKRQRKLASLEEEIAMLETELKQLSEEMTAAGVQGDGKRIAALNLQYAELDDMLASRYNEWSALAR